jgi:hypothetical protein
MQNRHSDRYRAVTLEPQSTRYFLALGQCAEWRETRGCALKLKAAIDTKNYAIAGDQR